MSPHRGRQLHIGWMLVWGAQMIGVAYLMWPWDWKTYLVEISLYANFANHLVGWSAERPSEIHES